MIKLVGFNISGMPNRNNRNNRRNNDQTREREVSKNQASKEDTGTERRIKDETEIGIAKRVRIKGGLARALL